MEGKIFAQIINEKLAEKGISKGEFYDAVGITSAAMWGWRNNNATPKPETVLAVEKFLGISFDNYENKIDPREGLRDDLRVLLKSAEDLPPSSVYELIAEIHRRKEAGKVEPSS